MERFKERLAIKIAWLLPRRVAMWAMIRVAAHATSGRWGHEYAGDIDYARMHDRWGVSDRD